MRGRNPSAVQIRDRGANERSFAPSDGKRPGSAQSGKSRGYGGRAPIFTELFRLIEP
jgi:hypothetical protein